MDVGIVREKVEEALAGIEDKYRAGGHKRGEDALRWWIAYNESRQAVDANNRREWAELWQDGMKPLPRSMRRLAEYVADMFDDDQEEDLDAWLEDMKLSYA